MRSTDGFVRVVQKALIGSAGLIFTVSTIAQAVPDLDTSFGVRGTANAAFDVPTSQFTDRGIAVFPTSSGGYALIGAADSATAGRERVGIAFYNAAGAATGSAITTEELVEVETACQIFDFLGGGYVVAGRGLGGGVTLLALTSAGALDTTKFVNGIYTIGYPSFEFTQSIHCYNGFVSMLIGLAPTDSEAGINEIATKVTALTSGPYTGGSLFLSTDGATRKPILLDGGSPAFLVMDYSSPARPDAFSIFGYDEVRLINQQFPEQIVDIPIASCGDMAGSESASIETAALYNGILYLGGSATNNGIGSSSFYEFFMEVSVASNGATTILSCNSRPYGSSIIGSSSSFRQQQLVARDADEFFWIGKYQTDSIVSSDGDPLIWRIRRNGSTWNVGEQIIELDYDSEDSFAGIPDEEANFGMIDTRTTPNALMVVGKRVWNGADTDATLTKLRFAPLFANGFE